jgi:fermentation-respiration switch protein FrsA (DUF1100 family)
MRMPVNCTPRPSSGTLRVFRGVIRLSLRVLLFAAVIAFSVYALLVVVLWVQQERVVFQPPSVLPAGRLTRVGGQAVAHVSYRAGDGTALTAYVVGDPRATRGTLIAFHGNADLARNLIPWAAELGRRTGFSVLLPELRGYDGLAGTPTYTGAGLDARAAYAFVRDSFGLGSRRLAYFGHSLGSAIATELAAEHPPRVLLLQSPFSSARAMARRMFIPGLALFWPIVSRVHYDTIFRVRSLAVPVWVAHGNRDLIIPSRMGREVFDAAAEKGELLVVAGAGHNDVSESGGDDYWRWVERALAT